MEPYLGNSAPIKLNTPTFTGTALIHGMDEGGVMFRPVTVERSQMPIDRENPLVYIPHMELCHGFDIPIAR